jgi:two-component system, OmpR family, phosphate regulon sensor histidine kinase PhoR
VDYIDVIRRSTRRMNNLLDDLLRVEEIRNSPDELMLPTQFADLVAKVVESARMLTTAKRQEFIADIELDNLPPIMMDPVLIREAMENLVSNAAKYTPEEGRVLVQSYYDERRVHFIVEDNGVGIPEKEVERIFNWGYRAKKHTNSTIEGTGLGLALVKSVVERHRGEVWAQTEEGVGSRFVFWLPR